MPKNIDVITLGPSLVMGIRSKDVGTDNYYNLGESGADIYDILAQLGLLEFNKVRFKKLIVCIDSYLFDKQLYSNADRNKYLRPYSNYMIDILNNKADLKEPKLKGNNIKLYVETIKNCFSLTYFQSSLKHLMIKNQNILENNNSNQLEASLYDFDTLSINGPAYLPDGSYVYPLKYQRQNLKDVLLSIKEYEEVRKNNNFTAGEHIDNFSKDIFEKIIKYYADKGVKIEFFICPLPPTYWEILKKYDYPIIDEQEKFAKELAQKYSLTVTGSMNPYNVGIKDEDFYDARHVRHELLSKYFDFKK